MMVIIITTYINMNFIIETENLLGVYTKLFTEGRTILSDNS